MNECIKSVTKCRNDYSEQARKIREEEHCQGSMMFQRLNETYLHYTNLIDESREKMRAECMEHIEKVKGTIDKKIEECTPTKLDKTIKEYEDIYNALDGAQVWVNSLADVCAENISGIQGKLMVDYVAAANKKINKLFE